MQQSLVPTFHPEASTFVLSAHGYAVEALCPPAALVTATDGSWERLIAERAQWAYSHGLEPSDGEYLREFRRRGLTLSQLGEALAVHGQTAQRVCGALDRLRSLELVEELDAEEPANDPTDSRAAAELHVALGELSRKLSRAAVERALDPRSGSIAIRRAIHRVIAARSLCDS